MAVEERPHATKGVILPLLTDAYQRRDRVRMVVFNKDRAVLVCCPPQQRRADKAAPHRRFLDLRGSELPFLQ
ncbi:MAG TPA: hypothetical protein PLD43_13075 [Anaerolineae bacterium]|nr:hypothetical protein [Anaerolineae bacterium]